MSESCCNSCGCKSGRLSLKNAALFIFVLALWVYVYSHLAVWSQWLTDHIPGVDRESNLAESIRFFCYDAPKVFMLLVLIVWVMGVIRTFFTPEKTRALLAGKSAFTGSVLAALLGVVTPFCSCSAVPLFIGFLTAGVPLGVTFSFLVSAPMVNEVALGLLFALFGWKIALAYMASGLLIAILSGIVLGKMRVEKWVEEWVFQGKAQTASIADDSLNWQNRFNAGNEAVRDIVGKVWPYLLLGIAVGAGIHGYVPESAMAVIMGREWWAVPLAVVAGVPLYSSAASMIPVVTALLEKGAALGTVLAFMMAVIGLSLPEMIILRRVLKWPLLATFAGVVAVGIVIVGWLFNALL